MMSFRTRTHGTPRQIGSKFPVMQKKKLPDKIKIHQKRTVPTTQIIDKLWDLTSDINDLLISLEPGENLYVGEECIIPKNKILTAEQKNSPTFILPKIKELSNRIKRIELEGQAIGLRKGWLGPSRFIDRAISEGDLSVAKMAIDNKKSDIHTYIHNKSGGKISSQKIFYHATSREKLQKILEEGLLPQRATIPIPTFNKRHKTYDPKQEIRKANVKMVWLAKSPSEAANAVCEFIENPVILKVKVIKGELMRPKAKDLRGWASDFDWHFSKKIPKDRIEVVSK